MTTTKTFTVGITLRLHTTITTDNPEFTQDDAVEHALNGWNLGAEGPGALTINELVEAIIANGEFDIALPIDIDTGS